LAWQSTETNQFGTNEFIEFCRDINTLPMLGVNMGTGTIEEAASLVEYCNAATGTYYGDLRAAHGYPAPHNVAYWCVGNEMDGPWQIGHLDAHEYAIKARETAKLMRWHDANLKLVLCGSSGTSMPTYPEWDRLTLETCWEQVDYHSLHYYVGNRENDTASYLASSTQFESHLDTLAGTLRYVKAKLRSKKDVYLSWDEWNIWYKDQTMKGNWTEAPHLIEEVYNLEDALVAAQWLNVFLRKCDVLKIACLAQIVNVIAPILTTRDGLLKQSIFYPFQMMRQIATGAALDAAVQAPVYTTRLYGEMPLLDVSASYDEATRAGGVFIVNRSQTETLTTDVIWQNDAPASIAHIHQLSGTDPKAANTFERPNAVVAKTLPAGARLSDNKLTLQLPPLSFTALATQG
jgi:alpha-N-arabinofuranosidase